LNTNGSKYVATIITDYLLENHGDRFRPKEVTHL